MTERRLPYVLASSGTQIADIGSGSTAETNAATITVPANAMGASGCLQVMTTWTNSASNANTRTVQVKLSASAGTTGTAFAFVSLASTISIPMMTQIHNRTATTQVSGSSASSTGLSNSANPVITAAITTTSVCYINLTVTKTTSGADVVNLERYAVYLFPNG